MTQFIFLLNSVKCVYRLHDRQRMYGQIRQLVAIQAVLVLLQDEIQTVPHKSHCHTQCSFASFLLHFLQTTHSTSLLSDASESRPRNSFVLLLPDL